MDDDDIGDNGRMALAELQALILRSRVLGYNGANMEVLYDQHVEDLGSALYRLDKYLTDKTEGRNQEADSKSFYELFVNGRPFHVHLSDGGYSRLTLVIDDGHPVVLDRSLSREPVKKRWADLLPPS